MNESVYVPLPRIPIVELSGNNRVLIENHCGVSAYTQEEIVICVSAGSVVVEGEKLVIAQIMKDRVVITGDIAAIRLCKEVRIWHQR